MRVRPFIAYGTTNNADTDTRGKKMAEGKKHMRANMRNNVSVCMLYNCSDYAAHNVHDRMYFAAFKHRTFKNRRRRLLNANVIFVVGKKRTDTCTGCLAVFAGDRNDWQSSTSDNVSSATFE